jgi:hypothetical protein
VPTGGVIYRKAGSKEPDGHVAETAAMAVYAAKRPPVSKERIREAVGKAVKIWLANGFTTASVSGRRRAAHASGHQFGTARSLHVCARKCDT